MRITLPSNDKSKLAMLFSTVTVGYRDHGAGRPFVKMETLGGAQTLYNRFGGEQQMLTDARAARYSALRAVDRAEKQLRAHCVNLCAGLRRNVKSDLLPEEVLRYYGIPTKGSIDYGSSYAETIQFAAQLQRGDDAAMAAGYNGALHRYLMDDARMTAEHALAEFAAAEETLAAVQEQFAQTREVVMELLREIRRELRFAVHHKPAAQQHTILHAYGLRRSYADAGDASGADAPQADPAALEPSSLAAPADAAAVDEVPVDDGVTGGAEPIPLLYVIPSEEIAMHRNGNGVVSAV